LARSVLKLPPGPGLALPAATSALPAPSPPSDRLQETEAIKAPASTALRNIRISIASARADRGSEKTTSDDSSRIVARRGKGGPRHPLFPLPLLPSGPGGVHSCCVTRDHKTSRKWPRRGSEASGQGAEGEGFEPSVPFSTHDFQSCTFGHSVTPPREGG